MINFALCDDNMQILQKLKNSLESIFIEYDLDGCVKFATSKINDLVFY